MPQRIAARFRYDRPDEGAVRTGTNIQVAYFDQMRAQLDLDKTLADTISPGSEWVEVNGVKKHVMSYLGDFLFAPERARSPVRSLSGGERNRVHMAKMLKSGANVLLLDEPSNDLDVDTLRALEDALIAFPGCVVVISHDRWFLDRIATHMIAFEGDSQVVWFEGNYQDYEADRRRRLGAEADQPHRIKYRPLIRKAG